MHPLIPVIERDRPHCPPHPSGALPDASGFQNRARRGWVTELTQQQPTSKSGSYVIWSMELKKQEKTKQPNTSIFWPCQAPQPSVLSYIVYLAHLRYLPGT